MNTAATLPGPLVSRNDGHPWQICQDPEDRIEWRRDRTRFRWVGICKRCGIGRALRHGDEPIVRTDEQLARGAVPPIPALDRYIGDSMPSLDYVAWT